MRSFRPAKNAGPQDDTSLPSAYPLSADSIFKNDLGQGLGFGVGDAEGDALHAELGGDFCGFAGEGKGGAAARFADYFEIDPADAVAPSGAERFHGGFFGGEAAGVTFEFILEALAIFDFAGREDAAKEWLAVTFDGGLDARDFGNIDTQSDDQNTSESRAASARELRLYLYLDDDDQGIQSKRQKT